MTGAMLETLGSTLERLAADPADQLAYLRGLGSPESADELALELDDVLPALLGEPDALTPAQRASLQRLDAQLVAMSGAERAEVWTAKALSERPEWDVVRACARDALREMGSAPAQPPA